MTTRSARPLAVTIGQVWAWMLFWVIVVFLPTPFGAWGDVTFYVALAGVVGMGASLTVTAVISGRRSTKAR